MVPRGENYHVGACGIKKQTCDAAGLFRRPAVPDESLGYVPRYSSGPFDAVALPGSSGLPASKLPLDRTLEAFGEPRRS